MQLKLFPKQLYINQNKETIMASVSGISLIKKLSLIFSRKAYLIYTNNPIPSLLIPVPTADKSLKSAIYKTFSDLTNDDILTFHNKHLASKDLNMIERQHKAKLNVDTVDLPHDCVFESVQGVEIKPNSVFLAVNQEDKSLVFMEYAQIHKKLLMKDTMSEQALRDSKKLKKEHAEKGVQKEDKKVKGLVKEENPKGIPLQKEKPVKKEENPKGALLQKEKPVQKNPKPQTVQPSAKERPSAKEQTQQKQQFKDQVPFQRKQMSTWNQQSPQLSTPPQQQPKQDISSMMTNKFIPLAYLTDSITTKPISIIHIQTSRQYILLQFLKLFCLANILCVYGLIRNWTRQENHQKARDGR